MLNQRKPKGETACHRLAKNALHASLKMNGLDAALERRFDIGDRYRTADIFVNIGAFGLVIEMQRCSISPKILMDRRKDYESLGLKHVWIAVAAMGISGKSSGYPSIARKVATISANGQRFVFNSESGVIYQADGLQVFTENPVAPSHFVPFDHNGEIYFSPFSKVKGIKE